MQGGYFADLESFNSSVPDVDSVTTDNNRFNWSKPKQVEYEEMKFS